MAEDIVTLTTRIAYANPWLRVREDTVRRRDGSDGLYGVVERCDFVIVVPHQAGRLTLVEQYRYPIRTRIWEFPMGMCDQPPADPAASAARELAEETGLAAATLLHAGTILQAPGYSNQRGHVFLATGLSQGPVQRESTEQDMHHREVPVAAFEAMVRDNVLQDAMSIAAFGLLRLKGLL